MAKTDFESVDAYLAAQPAASRPVLDAVRATLRAALPDAEERISYQIPGYRQRGRTFLYFSGWKEHWSLHPAPPALLAAFGDELAGHHAGKGTLRFSLAEPPPRALLTRIAAFMLAQVPPESPKRQRPR